MSAKVLLKFSEESLKDRVLYAQNQAVVIGRLKDCDIVVPETCKGVSGRHCVIKLNPDCITVQDLGSLNGTFLNGTLIGKRDASVSVGEAGKQAYGEFPVQSGDTLCLGKNCEITLKVKASSEEMLKSCINKAFMSDEDDLDTIYSNQLPGYRTVQLLDSGGMGTVWLVEEEETGKQMALKFMNPLMTRNEQLRGWFQRECFNGGQLEHPNVIKYYKWGMYDNTFYLLMDYCAGGDIKDLITRNQNIFYNEAYLTERIAISTHILLQMLEGLHSIHHAPVKVTLADGSICDAVGMVHRDIKPKNILLSDDSLRPEVKVADLGFAKAFQTADDSVHTGPYDLGGNLMFVPRQQILNYRHAKPEVDVWAAAATYYFMLTGFPPKGFESGSNIDWSTRLSAVPVRRRIPQIPVRLAKVIDKALMDNPKIGFQTALELKTAILEAL